MVAASQTEKRELLLQLDSLDEHAVLRDTFLVLLEDGEMRELARRLATYLYHSILESSTGGPGPRPGSPGWSVADSLIVRDLRAAANDMAYLRAFLHEEVHEATSSQIGPQEGELAMVAQRASGELEEVEVKLRAALRAAGAAP